MCEDQRGGEEGQIIGASFFFFVGRTWFRPGNGSAEASREPKSIASWLSAR